MNCRITDSGPQTPEDIRINREPDEDYEYECWRQREMDEFSQWIEAQKPNDIDKQSQEMG